MLVVFLYDKYRNVSIRIDDVGLFWRKEGKERNGSGLPTRSCELPNPWNFVEKGKRISAAAPFHGIKIKRPAVAGICCAWPLHLLCFAFSSVCLDVVDRV